MRLGPGLSFSWRRALGVSAFKGRIARRTGIPTTRCRLERKVGRTLIHGLLPCAGDALTPSYAFDQLACKSLPLLCHVTAHGHITRTGRKPTD